MSQDTSSKKSDGDTVQAESLILNHSDKTIDAVYKYRIPTTPLQSQVVQEVSAVAALKLIIEALDQRPLTYGCVAEIFNIVEPFREH